MLFGSNVQFARRAQFCIGLALPGFSPRFLPLWCRHHSIFGCHYFETLLASRELQTALTAGSGRWKSHPQAFCSFQKVWRAWLVANQSQLKVTHAVPTAIAGSILNLPHLRHFDYFPSLLSAIPATLSIHSTGLYLRWKYQLPVSVTLSTRFAPAFRLPDSTITALKQPKLPQFTRLWH